MRSTQVHERFQISKFVTEFTFRSLAEEHQENLPYYLEAEGYDAVLKILDKVLDFFEDELGQDDRVGQWLGGAQLCVADITLGEKSTYPRKCFILLLHLDIYRPVPVPTVPIGT